MKTTAEIRSRDPYILPDAATGAYYLYVAADLNAEAGTLGFDAYRSRDLAQWDGPIPVYRPAADFWGTMNFWAPEVHAYAGRYYLFATFKAPGRYRGTQILAADSPAGPFVPLTAGPVTPPDWECLDGTFHLDAAGRPWMVFCHEWVQVHNGGMWALPLTADLTAAADRPSFLFNASEAPWKRAPVWPGETERNRFPTYVTDGPFLYRTQAGELLMLWSSFGERGYAVGIARSAGGGIEGPWSQDPQPLYAEDGGHAMLFRAFGGRLWLSLHAPNGRPNERLRLHEVVDTGRSLELKDRAR